MFVLKLFFFNLLLNCPLIVGCSCEILNCVAVITVTINDCVISKNSCDMFYLEYEKKEIGQIGVTRNRRWG